MHSSLHERFRRAYLFLFLILVPASLYAEVMDRYRIGPHGTGHAQHPAWFKQSLLDLPGDLADARKAGKRGILIFFSQENCFHCQAFIDTTLRDKVIVKRLTNSYDVIGLDIFSDNEVTRIDGMQTTVKNFAEHAQARFTPTLLFIGVEGKLLLRIVGFYPPEKFARVLDYLEGGHYRRLTLRAYLQTTKQLKNADAQSFDYERALFETPPLALNQVAGPNQPLLVVFENPACNPCERFHQRILSDSTVRDLLGRFRAVQLNAADHTRTIITPEGREMTAADWADQLQINYEVAVVFFDARGKEVHRIDSEFGKDRFLGSMQYVAEQAYLRYGQFLQWRKAQAIRKNNQ
jgi:thioredoxin-related protein